MASSKKKQTKKKKPSAGLLGSGMAKSAASKLKAAQARRKKRLDNI